jgi:class 3 adenylate cyclase/predicted ATPase
VDELEKWLTRLGLSALAPKLRANDVDLEVLPALTEADLQTLGLSLGHRRKLLKAAASLAGLSSPSSSPTPSIGQKEGPSASAERRHLTVMFVDLVGSTALSARLDPEDMREIIGAYHRCCAEEIAKAGGFVAKYMGDGVLAYFGYPQAHEDDAEQAVRSAFALIKAVPDLQVVHDAVLQVRLGIATGLVVVGDLVGEGDARERGVVGDTPNLAARLQAIAEPDAVVIAESTRKLIGDLFEVEDLGQRELKGLPGPVRAWAALRPSAVESRFEALHGMGTGDLVGRAQELDLLLRCWSMAKARQGQVVLLAGEAGIGKSRLTAALLQRLANEPHARLRYFCSSQHTNSAFHPIIAQMERAAGLARDDPSSAKLNKLDALLARTSTSAEEAALLVSMLSIPNDGRYPTPELTPQQRRQRTLEALRAQLAALASRNPALVVFEDVHWIDPTSLEALKGTVEQARRLPVLVIVTFRPEFAAPWTEQPHVTSLALDRLGQHDCAAIVANLLGGMELAAGVTAEILGRTDGIPLFVEEMTKAVLETAGGGASRREGAPASNSAPAVPMSLNASLMARLDRLGPAREVAQIGAAIGREFSYDLLAAVAAKPKATLDAAIGRLQEAGLLSRHGADPGGAYLFKHALVQDAAYSMLLRGPRRALHARVAAAIESQFPDIAETQPELVARHCAEAGLTERAARLWGKAGERSLARSALVEASEQLTRALAAIASLPATPELRREAMKLQVSYASVLFHVMGYTAPETIAAFERADAMIEEAEALGERPEDALLRFSVLYGQWTGNYTAGNLARALEVARHSLAVAERQRLSAPLLVAHRMMGGSLGILGELRAAMSHLDAAVALYDATEHGSLATRFGQDIGVAALDYRSFVSYRLGYPESALRDADHALRSARELGQTGTLVYALMFSTVIEFLCGGLAASEARADELLALSERYGLAYWSAAARLWRGWVCSSTGRGDQAIALISSSLAELANSRTRTWALFSLVCLARAQASCGRLAEAERAIDQALKDVDATNERWDEAEALRTAGEIALMGPRPDPWKADAYFGQALAVARRQQARSWELRAATSAARLRRGQGRLQEARELLAPVYGWFTEGFATGDLIDAKALLDDLRSH